MIRNYLKIAWRNLVRHKAFSAINITGLSIGLTACLLISLFVFDELNYDRFNTHSDRIVRVVMRGTVSGEKIREANVMAPVAQTLQTRFPEVLATTRLQTAGRPRLTYGDKTFRDDLAAYADSTLFTVFTLPLVKGNPRTALARPKTMVLTAKVAQKYFGPADPLGKVLLMGGEKTAFTVTGVMADIPASSHFHFDFFLSMASSASASEVNWMRSNFFTYLLLPNGYDYRQLEAKLPQVVETHMVPPLEKMLGVSMADFRSKGNEIGLYLQPLTDIHLHSDLKPESEIEPGGDARYVYLFGAIALFMLLLACINFMNLSTAGASKRAKEVGIRKVLGSEKRALVGQFLSESALLTALSMALSVGAVWLLLPLFNDLSGKALTLSILANPWLLLSLVMFGLFVSVLAGSYPAFFLSSFKPIATLKGGTTPGSGSQTGSARTGLRSGLVVFQFFVSITLMIGTTVVYQQLQYIQSLKLGYDKDQVLVLENTWALGKNEAVFRRQLAQDARIVNASVSGFLPNEGYNMGLIGMLPEGNKTQLTRLAFFGVDDQYIPTLGMKLAAGRNFSASFPTDSSGVIINETAARLFGWSDKALGRRLTRPAMPGSPDSDKVFRVIGVVKDFHFRSLHERITPLVMTLSDNSGSIIIKSRAGDVAGLLHTLKQQWAAFHSEEPFRYSFLDEKYQATYLAEHKTGRILALFAGLTIFIACLGLFGLAMFTAEQRTKEIGVRKVLGASVTSLVALLSRDFLKPVAVAILIASPIAWHAMNQWLNEFAYRIDIAWWVFVLAGLLAVGIALLTVSFQSIRAALMNPVKSLRSE